ncbi:MAG: ANTAR domain-containing protein [Planctomycetota bacterium]
MNRPRLRILVHDEDAQRGATLAAVLRVTNYEVVEWSDADAPLANLVADAQPDVVLINLSSPDRDTLEQLTLMRSSTPRPVVMFAQDDDERTIDSAVRAGVSAYIVGGLASARVKPIIDVAVAHFRQHQAVREELEKTRATLDERKHVDRAKTLLMRQRGIGEPEAYALLRKFAMDRKARIGQVAKQLVATAELLEGADP